MADIYLHERDTVVCLLGKNPDGMTRTQLVKKIWPHADKTNPHNIRPVFQTVLNQLLKAGKIKRKLIQIDMVRTYLYTLSGCDNPPNKP